MSMLAAVVTDRLAQHLIAMGSARVRREAYQRQVNKRLSAYGIEWAHTDIPDLLSEARRLADDYQLRTGMDRSRDVWRSIEDRIDQASSTPDMLREYGVRHAEADITILSEDIEALEAELRALPPRM